MFRIPIILLLTLATIVAGAQTKVAEEPLHIEASTATVRTWFDRIEKQGRLTLSYNPTLIDMDQRITIAATTSTTTRRLLSIVLADYQYRLVTMESRKLLLQIIGPKLYDLTGIIREAESGEHLLGATIVATDQNGRKTYAVTDRNGVFNVSLRRGKAQVAVSYVGYAAHEEQVDIKGKRMMSILLKPIPFKMKTIDIKRRKVMEELEQVAPSNLVSFSNADLFSQIRILPGVSSTSANMNFSVAGGSTDENLFMLDGFPVYNPGHINSMLTLFNGDAIKSVSFYNGFIPTQYEGRLSSVTDVRLREGNKQQYRSTLSLDMPSASVVTEGPIIKNKLSYLVSGRHSWLDFFDRLLSKEDRMNHTFYDANVKLSYDIDSVTSISLSAYSSVDNYHQPEDAPDNPMLHWNNQLYTLHFGTIISNKIRNSSSVGYSIHSMRANAIDFLVDSTASIRNQIRGAYANTQFTYSPGQIYTLRWGLKATSEKYNLRAIQQHTDNKGALVNQISLYLDNRVRITPWLYAQLGFNFLRYMPRHHKQFNSVQPRFSLKAAMGTNDLLHLSATYMEQFFHHVRINTITTPLDFIMPGLNGFSPSRATHLELGWLHYTQQGMFKLSAYYKRRGNILALRPSVYVKDTNWPQYIMSGKGESYGASLYYHSRWRQFNWQLAYTLSKSKEWFAALPTRGKIPAINDFPHMFNGALSYEPGKKSMITIGGNLHSGRIINDPIDDTASATELFRTSRKPLSYRIDASYSYQQQFGHSRLLVRLGLYNIMGNPDDEDMFYYFSVQLPNRCIPHATVSFKF